MKIICLVIALFIECNICFAQTKSETLEYLKGKILAFGQDVTSVNYNESMGTLMINYKSGRNKIQYFKSLDANGLSWELADNNKQLILKIAAFDNRKAELNFKEDNKPDLNAGSFATITFVVSKVVDDEKFQVKITKAYKRLILFYGGKKEEEDPFGK